MEQVDEGEVNLKEWGLRARRISRENTKSRRFSASNLKSLREDELRSFRSNVSVSSTASSPGYNVREEIDPSTYSFTSALRALQAKTLYTWEVQPRDGLTLNSKWNEAEKYISNPLSGEVPLECLSAKTLSGRSFRGRMSMSAPLIYPSQMHHFPTNEHEHELELIISTEKNRGTKTRDVGTQSTPIDLSSSSPSPSPSPAPTPSIEERPIKMMSEADLSSVSLKSDTEVEAKETREEREGNGGERKKQWGMGCYCVSLRGLWMRTQSQKQKQKHKTTTNNTTFLHHLNASKQSNYATK